MLTYKDCVGLCDLEAEEILAVADHEHIPEIAALLMAEDIIHAKNGEVIIENMIVDDIESADSTGDLTRARSLRVVLRHFADAHPHPEQRL